ncbi:amino-acid transporter arg-13 [Fusarium flagelliforme]|uniref:Amino-acid transporter arg-13 n=1 Tax=Fusarium flagelliforme TaxID=2675880 RepID=A0A395MYJ1_9HYPO|nr:amino-acid transporter arg-13 [Fusarium flagelliforme]
MESVGDIACQALRYSGPLDCFRKSVNHDGISGLYRGVSGPVVGAIFETSSLFFFESLGRKSVYWLGWLPKEYEDKDAALPLPILWYSGAFSGAFTSFVLTPIELIKCNMQVSSIAASSTQNRRIPFQAPTVQSTVRGVYRLGGLRGFWRGQTGTFIREVGGGAAWFGFKETTTRLFYRWHERGLHSQEERNALRTRPLPLWEQAVAGASAGLSYNFLFFPADTVKSRIQTSASMGGVRKTFLGEARFVWYQSGLRGFYRGCGITLVKAAPASAFIFVVYDGLRRQFHMTLMEGKFPMLCRV